MSTDNDDLPEEGEELHEVEAAYALALPGTRWPTLMCSCGFAAKAPTWEEAGAEFDEHVEAINT
jgi:hypothetical protein